MRYGGIDVVAEFFRDIELIDRFVIAPNFSLFLSTYNVNINLYLVKALTHEYPKTSFLYAFAFRPVSNVFLKC